jgi:predicted SnoaL-like aldol condensation-catalyzing enzyme
MSAYRLPGSQPVREPVPRPQLPRGDKTMNNIEKVLSVFRGIESRDPDLTTKYMNPAEYKQHNPHAADGVEGLREYIRHLPKENHHLKVVRAFQDGPYVFSQEEG